MFDLTKLQALANSVGSIAASAAAAFMPDLSATVDLGVKVVNLATGLANDLTDTEIDQTELQEGLQALIVKVEAHADATIKSLGDDTAGV